MCVTFQPAIDFCSVPNLPHLCQFVHCFALQWLLIFILLGTSALQTFGLCQPLPNSQTCLRTILPPLTLQQQLLTLNFVPTMRRNHTFGSASLRPSLQRQESNHKNSNMQTHLPACLSKSFGTFWISRFGVPETITSERGLQFTSSLWLQLCEMLNISHKQTTSYHPESNGEVERLHRCLKDVL